MPIRRGAILSPAAESGRGIVAGPPTPQATAQVTLVFWDHQRNVWNM